MHESISAEALPAVTPLDQANLLAGQAVAYATAYLDGRHDAAKLGAHADKIMVELLAISDSRTAALLDPVRLLTVSMMRTAAHALVHQAAEGGGLNGLAAHAPFILGRLDRWQHIMGCFVELVRHEARGPSQ
jgi:hypothetical protein